MKSKAISKTNTPLTPKDISKPKAKPQRYDLKYLNDFVKDHGLTLVGTYDKVGRDIPITIKCMTPNCTKDTCKGFKMLTVYKNFNCREHNGEIIAKKEATSMKNYGTTHPMKSKKIQDVVKGVLMEKYNCDNPMGIEGVKDKMKDTYIKNYNVDNPMKCEKVKETHQTRYKEKYGVINPFQNPDVKQKIKDNHMNKFGFNYASQHPDIKQKAMQTCIKKYGCNYAMQNAEIAEKSLNNSFKVKEYIFSSGGVIFVQGYEPFALDDLVKDNVNEDDIMVSREKVPEIWWSDENSKKHRYYVDIFIPSQNFCIEVKSEWTYSLKTDNIHRKQQAVKDAGFDCEIWIYSPKAEIIRIIK